MNRLSKEHILWDKKCCQLSGFSRIIYRKKTAIFEPIYTI